jgi:hypothetical protein
MVPVRFINGNNFRLIEGLFYGLFVKTLIYLKIKPNRVFESILPED